MTCAGCLLAWHGDPSYILQASLTGCVGWFYGMQTSDFADLHQSCSACNAHIATSLQRISQFQVQEVIHVPIASGGVTIKLLFA